MKSRIHNAVIFLLGLVLSFAFVSNVPQLTPYPMTEYGISLAWIAAASIMGLCSAVVIIWGTCITLCIYAIVLELLFDPSEKDFVFLITLQGLLVFPIIMLCELDLEVTT